MGGGNWSNFEVSLVIQRIVATESSIGNGRKIAHYMLCPKVHLGRSASGLSGRKLQSIPPYWPSVRSRAEGRLDADQVAPTIPDRTGSQTRHDIRQIQFCESGHCKRKGRREMQSLKIMGRFLIIAICCAMGIRS